VATYIGAVLRTMHNRQALWLIMVAILLLAGLLASRTEKLTEDVWPVKLMAGCALDYHTSYSAVALACPGVDYTRLWPLPVIQPSEEPERPAPGDGQIARLGLRQDALALFRCLRTTPTLIGLAWR
jgi:hypothetical protein